MLEGYLRKWVNIMYGWKPRYFILHDGLLTFCEEKGGRKKGTVYLRIAKITVIPEDPLRIVLHTGTTEIHVRGETQEERDKWYQALKKEQEECVRRDDVADKGDEITSLEKHLSPQAKALTKDINLDSLKDKLAELWVVQAQFDETLSSTVSKAKNNPGLTDQLNQLETLGNDLKYKLTDCVSKVEDEKKKVVMMAKRLDLALAGGDPTVTRKINFEAGGNQQDDEFLSFEEDDDDDEEEEKFDRNVENIVKGPPARKASGIRPQDLKSKPGGPLENTHPLIKTLINNNPAYLETRPIPKEHLREKMPNFLDPNQKMNILAIAKELIGKDLTRFAVPVWLNEPLSMLQKLCEQLEYARLLDTAAQQSDPCLRLAYAVAFSFSYHSSTIKRHKKPFNPILGETFEYVPVDGAFKFLSEQVSHHPPISAGYAESDNFEWWGDTQLKTNFKGTSLDVTPLGSCHIKLKKHGDHIVYRRPVTSVCNIILGTMYVENYGEVPYENLITGETGFLNLKKRGWGDRGAYESEGWIKDKAGNTKYTLQGKWNSYLTAIETSTKREIKLWERLPLPDKFEEQYCFTQYTKQLNYVYEDLIPHLPPTDCRLRPDQRALEYGFNDIARDEKFRLEEKQRSRRKDLQMKGEVHTPKWFKESKDDITGEKSYHYVGGYFDARESGNFGEVLDLY